MFTQTPLILSLAWYLLGAKYKQDVCLVLSICYVLTMQVEDREILLAHPLTLTLGPPLQKNINHQLLHKAKYAITYLLIIFYNPPEKKKTSISLICHAVKSPSREWRRA